MRTAGREVTPAAVVVREWLSLSLPPLADDLNCESDTDMLLSEKGIALEERSTRDA